MSTNITGELLSNILIESLLVILILFSPLIYGGVTNLALTLIEITNFLLLFVFLVKLIPRGNFFWVKTPTLPLLLFFLLLILQLIPLPEVLISFLSPAASLLNQDFRVTPAKVFTLSVYPEATINMLLQVLSYLAIFFVVLNYIDTERKGRRLITTIIIAGFLYSLYGIINKLSNTTITFSTFGNANHFAAYIELIIPLAIVFSFVAFSLWSRFIFLFMAIVEILALFFTLSRGGIACFFLSFLILSALLYLKKPVKKNMGLMIILVFGVGLFFMMISLRERVLTELKTLFSANIFSVRALIFKDTLKIAQDFPLFGTGLGTFAEAFNKYKTFFSEENVYSFGFAHNESLQFLSEVGILGFVCIFWFLFRYLRDIFSRWSKRNNPYAILITLGCLIGLVSIGLHSFLDFVLHIPANAVLAAILLALAFRAVYTKEPQKLLPVPQFEIKLSEPQKKFLIIILCAVLIYIGLFTFRRFEAKNIFERLERQKITEVGVDTIRKYRRSLKEIDKAIESDRLNAAYIKKKADLLSEFALREDLGDSLREINGVKGQEGILYLAQRYYRQAIDLNPLKAEYHLKLGWVDIVLNKADLAKKELEKAILLDPQNFKMRSYIEKLKENAF